VNKTGKMIIIIVSIVVLSLFEVMLIRGFSGQKQMIDLCVASTDIAQNSLITAQMVGVQSFPADALPAFGVQNAKELVGRYATTMFRKGELLSSFRVVADEDRKRTSKGNVYISLMPSPEDALGWQLSKGDFVSLMGVRGTQQDGGVLLLHHIKIADLIDASFKSTRFDDLEKKPKFLILEVTPNQAKEIVRWRTGGKIVIIGNG